MLLKPLPAEVARDVSSYVGCVSGASLLTEYLSTALAAGLRNLSIPSISHGSELVNLLAPEGFSTSGGCCGATVSIGSSGSAEDLVREAAEAVASIKLHGRK